MGKAEENVKEGKKRRNKEEEGKKREWLRKKLVIFVIYTMQKTYEPDFVFIGEEWFPEGLRESLDLLEPLLAGRGES